MKSLVSYLHVSIAYVCFVHLLVLSEEIEESLESLPGRLSGFRFDLRYDNLVATVNYGGKLDIVGNDPDYMWTDIAKQIERDSRQPPYSQRTTSERYDVWPKMTTGFGHLVEPSYLVRFSLVQVPGQCDRRRVDRGLLLGVSRMFHHMALFKPKMDLCFSGEITKGREILFQFKLYGTGPQPARKDKIRNIQAPDLEIINKGRRTILEQTTSSDLLIFIGSSGSYFYYAINRPSDPVILRRNAYLLPVSSASLWTQFQMLDIIWKTPEFSMFIRNVLWPIFNPTHRLGYARVIFVDYIYRGMTLRGLQAMLIQKGIYYGALHYINIESPQDPPPPYGLEHFIRLNPIWLSGHAEVHDFVEGGFGRIVPPYPWYYWDVPPEAVEYPEKPTAQNLIDIIRADRLKPEISLNGNSSSVPRNHGAVNASTDSAGTKPGLEPGMGSETDLLWRLSVNTTGDDFGYNDNASSIPSFPDLSQKDCLQNSTDRVVNLTRIPVQFGQIPTSSIIETS